MAVDEYILLLPILKVLRLLYVIPSNEDKYYHLKAIVMRIIMLILPIVHVISIIGMLRKGEEDYSNEIIINGFLLLVPMFGICISGLILIFKSSSLEKSVELLSDLKKFNRPEQDVVVEYRVKVGLKIVLLIIAITCAVNCLYGFPILRDCTRDNEINENCYKSAMAPYVFAKYSGFPKLLLTLIMSISICYGAFSTVIVISYAVSCSELTISRIIYLKNKLICDLYTTEGKYQLKLKLKDILEYYSNIISTTDLLNNSMGEICLIYFMFGSCAIGALCYISYSAEFIIKMIFCLHAFCWVSFIFLICAASQRLLDEHDSLRHAFYNLPWYDEELHSVAKDIMLIILRCQREVGIKAGPFGIMTLSTFGDIMRATYSVIILLRR